MNKKNLQFILILPLSYLLILFLYFINKSHSTTISEPKIDLYHLLDQEMLRETDYKYLILMQQKKIAPTPGVLKEYEEYFQLVTTNLPNQWDSYGMLGYCQYYLGDNGGSIESYEKALQINPGFLEYYYNLALIYHHQGDDQKTVKFLKIALELPIQAEAQSMLSSVRIYGLMLSQMPGDTSQNIIKNFLDQKQKAIELLKIIVGQSTDTSSLSLQLL